MAWEDRTPFEAITFQLVWPEEIVVDEKRNEAKQFQMWRKRVTSRTTKYQTYAAIRLAGLSVADNGLYPEIKSVNVNYFLCGSLHYHCVFYLIQMVSTSPPKDADKSANIFG
jgi:uncharacterized protein (TIGR03643 family)